MKNFISKYWFFVFLLISFAFLGGFYWGYDFCYDKVGVVQESAQAIIDSVEKNGEEQKMKIHYIDSTIKKQDSIIKLLRNPDSTPKPSTSEHGGITC
jgi:hypothetical protein